MRLPFGDDPLPNRAGESWRSWLMTGVRRGPVDRRRVRGAHVGIKKLLVEGMGVRGERPYTWKEFSDAMVRQAVGDAMQTLSYRDSQLVKLAYFGGLTNREIAGHMQMKEATVQRRLRASLDAISDFVQRGRGFGHRVLFGLAVWLSGRTASDAMHGAAQGVVVAAAAAIIATHPASLAAVERAHAPAAGGSHAAAPVVPPLPSPSPPVTAASQGSTSPAGAVTAAPAAQVPAAQLPSPQLPSVQVPSVQVPPVQAPELPQAPVKVEKPALKPL